MFAFAWSLCGRKPEYPGETQLSDLVTTWPSHMRRRELNVGNRLYYCSVAKDFTFTLHSVFHLIYVFKFCIVTRCGLWTSFKTKFSLCSALSCLNVFYKKKNGLHSIEWGTTKWKASLDLFLYFCLSFFVHTYKHDTLSIKRSCARPLYIAL